jgi:transposase
MNCTQKVGQLIGCFFMSRKIKYSYDLKLSSVKAFIDDHQPARVIANQSVVPLRMLYRWIFLYRHLGAQGLAAKQNGSYSPAFKRKVLRSIEKHGLSLPQACVKFSLGSDAMIIDWKRKFEEFGLAGLVNKPKGIKLMEKPKYAKKLKFKHPLTREQELLLELQSLRAENALLKKLQALIQAEEEANKRKPFKN